MGVDRIELALGPGLIEQSELDRNIVKPAGCETAVEMPQSWNDHSNNRNLDVGAGVIEDEKIEAGPFGKRHAGLHLPARIELAEVRTEARSDRGMAAWDQIGIVVQSQWSNAVKSIRLPASHETDGHELVQLGERAQNGDPGIEVRAGAKLDIVP